MTAKLETHPAKVELRPVRGIVIGVAIGVTGFLATAAAEVSSRLSQGGAGSLLGLKSETEAANWGEKLILAVVLVVMMTLVLASAQLRSFSAQVAAVVTVLVLVAVGWIAFHQPTLAAFRDSPGLTMDRLLHAGSTSVGTVTFVAALIAVAVVQFRAFRRETNQ